MLDEMYFRIGFAHKQIEQLDDPAEIFRYQGEIRALRSLTRLRDKVNNEQQLSS